jgi:ATP-dependent Clp protease adaptor protein ClpS
MMFENVLLDDPLVEHDLSVEVGTNSEKNRSLILYNDEYHTFEYVIDALVDVCQHDLVQAEQCTYIVHFNGKCDVKKGTFSQLKPMKDALIMRELNVTID